MVDVTPDTLTKQLINQAPEIVEFAAIEAAQRFRRRTPGDRPKTKSAVFVEFNGNTARIGLRFKRNYPAKGTPTKRRFEKQWQAIRPIVRQQIVNQLNQILKG